MIARCHTQGAAALRALVGNKEHCALVFGKLSQTEPSISQRALQQLGHGTPLAGEMLAGWRSFLPSGEARRLLTQARLEQVVQGIPPSLT